MTVEVSSVEQRRSYLWEPQHQVSRPLIRTDLQIRCLGLFSWSPSNPGGAPRTSTGMLGLFS
jgi:hypothetical protein